jgi:hypothetical protein
MTTPSLWFGMHKGLPLTAVPAPYLAWMLGAVSMSPGARQAIETELARRRGEAGRQGSAGQTPGAKAP